MASSAGVSGAPSRGRASDATRALGRPPPAERRRPGALGELKFKCDPRLGLGRGRESAAEGGAAGCRKAWPLKGQGRPARSRLGGRRGATLDAPASATQFDLSSPEVRRLSSGASCWENVCASLLTHFCAAGHGGAG